MESKVLGVTDVTSGAGRRDVPLMEVSVDLAQGMAIKTDRCVGDVPILEVITGGARLVISVDVGDVRRLGAEDVLLAEEFAEAACELRDELQRIVADRRRSAALRVVR